MDDARLEYVAFAADVARAAGEILNYYAARDKRVEHKGRANLVTVADLESEALIIREIHARYPNHTILAEESGLVDSSSKAPDPDRWIIDPLDGTTNTLTSFRCTPFRWASSGAGKMLCGAVYDPVRDEMFTGSRGSGAFLNGEPVLVSGVSSLSEGLLLTGLSLRFPGKSRSGSGSVSILSGLLSGGPQGRIRSVGPVLHRLRTLGRVLGTRPRPLGYGCRPGNCRGSGWPGHGFQRNSFFNLFQEILASNGAIHEEMMAAIANADSG